MTPYEYFNYFTDPDSALRSLHSVLTVVGGAVVHSGAIKYRD